MASKNIKYQQLIKNIKKARVENNLTQDDLADKLDISREHLAKVETLKRGMSFDLLFKICDALNIKEKDLMDFD